MSAEPTEREEAIDMAHRLLDKPYLDPDGAECVIARQFLRSIEADAKALGEKDAAIARLKTGADEGRETVSEMATQLDSMAGRCEELEALVQRAVASQTVSGGQCHECWALPGLPHDATCWVGDAIRVLPLLHSTEGAK